MINSDTPFRAGNVEHLSTQRSNKVPKCILELPAANPARKPLSDEELKEAKKDLINFNFVMSKYARERKFRVDSSVIGQNIGIISFNPSKGSIPDKNGCYGVIKLRGNYPNTAEADKRCDVLLTEDENLDIDMPLVGKEFPLMINNEAYTYSVRDVDTKKLVTESTATLIKEKEEKAELEKKKMFDKQRKLLDDTNEEEKETTLSDYDLYVQLRTKKAHNMYIIDKRKGDIVKCKDNIEKTNAEIKEIDEKYPTYRQQYLKKYIDEIKQVGIDPKQMEIVQYMIDDVTSLDVKEEIIPSKITLVNDNIEDEVKIEEIKIDTLYNKDRLSRSDPEVLHQSIGLISFIPSKGATPDSQGSFGVLKLRGNFSTATEAEKWCENLIRNYDSYSVNELVFVGKEYPLFKDNRAFYKGQFVDEDLKDIMTKIVKVYLKEVEDKRKAEQKDMLDRQSQLRINENKELDKSSIDYYIVLNVKKAYNLHQMKEAESNIETALKVIENTQKDISDMEEEFTHFRKDYLDQYIQANIKAGNSEESDTLIKYMVDEDERVVVREALRSSVTVEEVEEKKEN